MRFLFSHAWIAFRRSPALGQNILQTVVLAFFAFYFAVMLLVVGVAGGELIREHFPGRDVLSVAGGFLIYFFVIDLITRYFFQKFPSLVIKPYLLWPISRKLMVNYLLIRSLTHFFNLLPLFFLMPFLFIEVVPNYGLSAAWGFVLFSIGFTLFNNFLAFGISKGVDRNNLLLTILLVIILCLSALEYLGYISLFGYLRIGAEAIITNPILWLLPISMPVLIFLILKRYFIRILTAPPSEARRDSKSFAISTNWFSRFGLAGKLMNLELKLMIRAKRARAYVLSAVFVLVLPLLMGDGNETDDLILIIYGLLMTGIIALNHGQLMLSWNSEHFDLLLTRGVSMREIFTAKYYLLLLSCVLLYVLSIPYLLYDPDILIFNTALLFVNASISIYLYMVLAAYNSLRIDPNEGGVFSISGFGLAHYLIGIPILIIPILLYYVGYTFGDRTGGLLVLSMIGLIGVLLHRQVINFSSRLFQKNRYRISLAFRKP